MEGIEEERTRGRVLVVQEGGRFKWDGDKETAG